MTSFFSSAFLRPNCLGNSFLYLKIVKIHFHGVPPLTHFGLQNAQILKVKAVRLGLSLVRFRKHTH